MKSEWAADVVVVGAGIMGTAAAMQLASRGHDVALVEQFEMDHKRGSSHGASRIFRLAYEEVDYVQSAREALTFWREAESQLDSQLIRRTGVLDVGPRERLDPISEALEKTKVPFDRLCSRDAKKRFPNFVMPEEWEVIFQADGGITYADLALGGFAELATRAGARILPETRVIELARKEGGMHVETTRGSFDAGTVVVTAAGWSTSC